MCIKINKIGKQEVGIWWVQKRFPRYGVPIWSLWPNIRFLPSIIAEKNVTKNEHICSMCIKINKVGKQEVGIRWVQKRFPRYGVPIWSLWPNIRSLPSIVAEKNVMKNVHICSMCIKINKVNKQEVGIWRVQKRYPQYGIPIWSLCQNIRFLPSIVAEKNATKNEHICSMCRKINKVGKQEVGIWWVQKRFPWYGVPIWSLWPNIRSLPSIVAEKFFTKNVHICSMCIEIK